jgi:hypothetical protein
MAAKTYLIHNSAQVTTAAPVSQPTGTAIRTMMQLAPATGFPMRIIEWGCSFDGSAAATPGKVELFDNTVAATMSTAFAAGDIQPYGDPNAPANSAGSSGIPLNLSTATSGFATAAVTEGTVANARQFDVQLVAPTNQYLKQFPLGREPEVPAGHFLRVRMTFGTTVNAYIYIVVEF